MVFIPGGEYSLVNWSRPTEKKVNLDDFFIDKYEVTNAEFKEFIVAGGYVKKEFWKRYVITDFIFFVVINDIFNKWLNIFFNVLFNINVDWDILNHFGFFVGLYAPFGIFYKLSFFVKKWFKNIYLLII